MADLNRCYLFVALQCAMCNCSIPAPARGARIRPAWYDGKPRGLAALIHLM
jgi:hypothetical protein